MAFYGQVVNIPDANFKNALITFNGVDTNGDGEIQESEAAAVTDIYVIGDSISSLEGIASFVNLQQLTCEQNLLTSLDVSQNTHLEWLNCAHNQLTSLVFPTSVHGLLCNNNQLAALDLSGRAFDFLDVSYNQLTELDLSQTDAYFTGFGMILGILGNLYTSFTMPDHYVDGFYCENTQLVTMDLSVARFVFQQEYKYIGNNPNLQYVNIKNGGTDFCTLDSDEMPCDGYSLVIENNPALAVLCADESELVHYAGAAQTVTSDCSGLGVASLEIGSAALAKSGHGCGYDGNAGNFKNFRGFGFQHARSDRAGFQNRF